MSGNEYAMEPGIWHEEIVATCAGVFPLRCLLLDDLVFGADGGFAFIGGGREPDQGAFFREFRVPEVGGVARVDVEVLTLPFSFLPRVRVVGCPMQPDF